MRRCFFGLLIAVIVSAWGWAANSKEELATGLYAQFKTPRGTMIFELDYENTPLTVANFVGLARGVLKNTHKEPGDPFFDGMPVYKAIKDYALFIGYPGKMYGEYSGSTFPREKTAKLSAEAPGVLVMDGLVSESFGSQFFITIQGDGFLDDKYTSFGKIVSGIDVLKKLKEDDIINSITILQIGADAEAFPITQSNFDALLAAARKAEVENLAAIDPTLSDIVFDLGPERKKSISGIYYAVLKPGEGTTPQTGNQVAIHYTGSLVDGQIFDSSLSRGQPFEFTVGEDSMIPGWIEMIINMKSGEVRKVVMPPEMGYGERGFGPIGPNSWLVFEIELLSII